MTRWKLTIEYDGVAFSGWQRQPHALSVQQVIEDAVFAFTGERTTVHVAGRTDAGVHAVAQVAHVDITKPFPAKTIRDATNVHMRPHPVAIVTAEAVGDDFHARFSAQKRHYRYVILNRRAPSALWQGRAWHVPVPLDVQAMHKAAQHLLGKHDFSTFRARDCQANSPIRTLDQLDVFSDPTDGDRVIIQTSARSFLYHQVRNMVGTLAMVGHGQWGEDDLIAAFAACDRCRGGPTAPPEGLYFWAVGYGENTEKTQVQDVLISS